MLVQSPSKFRGISRLLAFALAPAAFAQFSGVAITTRALPSGSINGTYFTQIDSTGSSSSTWVVGGLPPGITLAVSTGTDAMISGTPTVSGVYSVTIQVSDPQTDTSATTALSLAIAAPLAFATTSPLTTGMVGVTYSQNITATGGAGGYKFTAPAVPPGLQLTSLGVLFGTPTLALTLNIVVTVTDSAGASLTTNFSLTITQQLKFVTTSPLPSAVATAVYTQTLTASGGTVPYTFVITDTPPPGLTLATSGLLNGVPSSAGTFTFTVQVSDYLNFSTSAQFKVTFTGAPPLLQVSPSSLTLNATGGNTPPSQSLSIVSTNGTAAPYAITVDSGSANTPAPTWLTVTPTGGSSPARVIVTATPGQLTLANYKATIHITVPRNTSQSSIDIPVTFNLAAGSLFLQPVPPSLSFGSGAQTQGIQQQTIVLNNGGGSGLINYQAAVVNQSPWITSVTPASGFTATNAPVPIQVQVNSQGLAPGAYHDIIRLLGPSSSVDVPVTMFVSAQGPVLALNVTGVRFQARQGGGSSRPQNIPILNLGSPSTTVNWIADLLSGSNWLTVTTSTGTATPGQPGTLTLTPNSAIASLPAGPQYALVRVQDAVSQDSPQYLTAVLDNEPITSPPLPDPSPAGLFFTSSSSSGQVLVYTSTATPIGFQASASTNDGASWLSVTPSSGVASTATPGQISVAINASGLALGIYTGSINIGMSGVLRIVNVTMVVIPPGSAPSLASGHAETAHAATSCTPSALALTETGLVNNFAVPAGWPASLVVQLNDDCGNSVANGSVVASFSNSDPPLTLRGDLNTSTYSATWQPGTVQPQMTIALQARAGTLRPASAQLIGAISSNATLPPAIVPGGILSIEFNGDVVKALGGGLAPGNVTSAYGSGLASTAAGSATVPLQNQINGSFLLIGGIQAPLFYVSDSLVNFQIPYELNANQQYSAVISANGSLTQPLTVQVVPYQPAVSALNFIPTGTVNAQHSVDYSAVTDTSKAHPGETITIYLAGMGATLTGVPSGSPSPGAFQTSVQPTVLLDGQNCFIQYAGLTPSGIGLYQINFVVPTNARSGNLSLVVTQGTVPSNTTTLPVSN
jgi:large repetitive protein